METIKFPNEIKTIITDIDGVITTEDKKSIAPGIEERLSTLKERGITIIANTLRGVIKYDNIITGSMQEIIEFGISERGAIKIDKDKKVHPLLTEQDRTEILDFNQKIQDILIKKGATKGAGPYTCIQYFFADNKRCQEIIQEIQEEDRYNKRNNNTILEATSQGSIILTKKGVDKGFGINKTLQKETLEKTIVFGDDQVDEAMFFLPGITSFNVGYDTTLQATYTTQKKGSEATIEILDQLIKTLNES